MMVARNKTKPCEIQLLLLINSGERATVQVFQSETLYLELERKARDTARKMAEIITIM